ncbi:MAG: aminotransferase, partial [Gemmatimonadaceae bacterium]
GPYGLGYLYVAPKWREGGRPIEASWMTRRGAEDFTRLVDYTDEYRPGARRFDMGGFSQFVLSPMALAGVTQLLRWGVERVQSSVGRLTTVIAEEAMKMGCSVLPANRRVGHMVGIRFPDGIPAGLAARLSEKKVYVSIRGDSVRVAPHLYNSEDDAARFLAVLGEFV